MKKTQKGEKLKQSNSGKIFGGLKSLVAMQLKDKLDFSFFKNKKKTLFKIVFSILTFAILTAVIFLAFRLVISLGLFSFVKTLNFRVYLLLMTILFVLSFLSCLVNVTKTLYFSKDNTVLLTLPVSNGTTFASKLIVCWVYEIIKNTTYVLPFFFAYGLAMGISPVYYLWVVLGLILLTTLFVSLSGLLSIPAMWIAILFKKNRILEFVCVVIALALLIYGIVYVINLIPQNIDIIRDWGTLYWSIQDFLASFASKFFIFDYLLRLLTGMTYGAYVFTPFVIRNLLTFINCIVTILLSLGFVILLSRPLFLKMASNPFEYRKKPNKTEHSNKRMHPFNSASFKNAQIIFRTSNLILSVVAVAIIMPIAVFLQNKIVAAMDTRSLGNDLSVAFNILIILLMALSSNTTIASAYSREGNSAYLNKVNPVDYKIPLTGKIVLNALICVASIVCSTFVIATFGGIATFDAILLTLSLVFVYLAHLFWSAELDIMNPQNRLYQTTGDTQRNPNETKSTIIAFIMSALFTFACFFLLRENPVVVYIKMFIIALAVLIIRGYLYFTKIKLYYEEK